MKVEDAVRVARQGDIILVHRSNPDFISDAVEWFQEDGYVSHVCLAIDDLGRVVQATAKDGVCVAGIAEIAWGDDDMIVRRPRAPKAKLALMAIGALNRVGKRYGYLQGIWIGLYLILSKIGLQRIIVRRGPFKRGDAYVCSALIAIAAQEAGVDLGLTMPAECVTPEDLNDTSSMDTVSA
jgi:TusA-related sulfurtransferase